MLLYYEWDYEWCLIYHYDYIMDCARMIGDSEEGINGH